MNPVWFVRNVAVAWRSRGSVRDFVKRVLWTYADRLPPSLRADQYLIDFCYPAPIGHVRLLLRSNGGADNFIHSEVFEHEYYRLALPNPPSTVLDLGANAGFTAVYFAKRYPHARIACVEPMPDNLEVLRQNLALNSVPATVLAAAAHTSTGTLRMEIAARDYGHRVASATSQSGQTIEVRSLSIPAMLSQLGWSRIVLLKIDIEGHERTLLSEPTWLDRVEALCIECHEGFGQQELAALANRFGFAPPYLQNGLWMLERATSRSAETFPAGAVPTRARAGSRASDGL